MPEEQTHLFFRLFFFRLPNFKKAAQDYLKRSTTIFSTKLTSETQINNPETLS